MPFLSNKDRDHNALARFKPPSPFNPRRMALALRRDHWGKNSRDSLDNASYSYRRFLAQQRDAMGGRWGRGMYLNPYRNAFGRGGFSNIRSPHVRRPAYGGGYHGYGGYSRRLLYPSPRIGRQVNQFRRPYSRRPSWPTINYGGGLARMRYPCQPRYRAFAPLQNRRRTYGTNSYYSYDEDPSDDDYDESDLEENYYPSPHHRWCGGYRDWGEGDEDDDDDDDEDDDEWDDYGFEDLDDDDSEGDEHEYGYNSDAFDYGRYGYGGHRHNRRGYRY